MENLPENFCVLPFIHFFVNYNGGAFPCCYFARHLEENTKEVPYGNIKKNKAKTICNNEKFKQVKQDILNNTPPKACAAYCLKEEKFGGWSYRKWANSQYLPLIDGQTSTSLLKTTPSYWLVAFSNTCNFRCRSCNPYASSSIYKENVKFKKKFPCLTTNIDPPAGSIILEEIKSNYKDIQVLHFHGGEPLLHPEFWEILDFFILKKKTDIKIHFNTNTSTLSYKGRNIIDVLRNFKPENLYIQCSIDAVGERAELIRKGTRWKEVEKNILDLLQARVGIVLIGMTVGALSVFGLNQTIDYLIQKDLISKFHHCTNFYINQIVSPSHYSFSVIPLEGRKKIIKSLTRLIDKYKHYPGFEDKVNSVVGWVQNTPYNKEDAKEFIKFTQVTDSIRKENTYKTIPEAVCIRDYYLKNYGSNQDSN